ncbi:arylsulfatase [Tichowtungia aerotolerans]|uniref:Sulfatase-like hydrolase/transferase n=1 Tax=Tichowtungia aerotolerans TaxID=2697043 RepID=A0A6P1M9H5_9BACT|nr:arylsulfatase [Tichowtungia aerotolerans]QHI69713.1 sulfatase-like hydrolase/transferase [Tichowtungia aerotolerans]
MERKIIQSCCLFAGVTAAASLAETAAPRPNVLLIVADDIGCGDLACYGSPVADTPNLDRLKAHSLSFADYHVSPMCTPTRSSLMTGMDPIRTGADYVCMGRSLPRADLPMAPQLFKAAGYSTALFGKWHLGSNVPFRPQDRGFDEVLTFPGSHIASAPDYWENDYWSPMLQHNGEWKKYDGFCTDIWFDETMAWISEQADRPFFLYLPVNAAHGPFWSPEELKNKYLQRGLSDPAARFYGLIENLDWNLGRLVRFLEEKQLDQNTILIYSSDNGTAFGDTVYNAGMRGKKRSLYDGGHRVPLFVRWPGKLPAGVEISALVQTQDLLPTLLDLANISFRPGQFDGISLAEPLKAGSSAGLPDRMLTIQYGSDDPAGGHQKHDAAVIWNQWRLVGNRELYDLRKDPGQQTDGGAPFRPSAIPGYTSAVCGSPSACCPPRTGPMDTATIPTTFAAEHPPPGSGICTTRRPGTIPFSSTAGRRRRGSPSAPAHRNTSESTVTLSRALRCPSPRQKSKSLDRCKRFRYRRGIVPPTSPFPFLRDRSSWPRRFSRRAESPAAVPIMPLSKSAEARKPCPGFVLPIRNPGRNKRHEQTDQTTCCVGARGPDASVGRTLCRQGTCGAGQSESASDGRRRGVLHGNPARPERLDSRQSLSLF